MNLTTKQIAEQINGTLEGDSDIKVGDSVIVGFVASRCHLFDQSKQSFK